MYKPPSGARDARGGRCVDGDPPPTSYARCKPRGERCGGLGVGPRAAVAGRALPEAYRAVVAPRRQRRP